LWWTKWHWDKFSSSISLVGVPVIPPLLYAHSSVTAAT